MLFSVGTSINAQHIIQGSFDMLPFAVYEYRYEVGIGKHRRFFDAMIMEITLPRVLPHLLIDSELEDVVPIVFDKSQKIELEGDFHKYFDLYAPDSYGVSALTILAPDVMQVLMEHTALCDVEIVQNKLYFYWPTPATSKRDYVQIFETAQAVISKLGKRLTEDNIFTTAEQALIHANPTSSGVRLKNSKTFWIAILLVLGYPFVAQVGGSFMLSRFGILGSLLFVVAVFIVWLLKKTKHNWLRRQYFADYRKDHER